MPRPDWDTYFLNLLDAVAERSTCDRGKCSAIIVRDKRILCTGYAGSPSGMPHCDEAGHDMKEVAHADGTRSQHCMRTLHAEQNAVCQAAFNGIPINRSTLYCKFEPCAVCAKLMIQVGIGRVVCQKRYHRAQETRELFERAGVKLDVMNDETESYSNQS